MLEPFSFDRPLLAAFNQQLPDYQWFFYAITQLGSSLTITILASLAFLLCKGRMKTFAAILLIGVLFGSVIVGDLKDTFERPRPPGANTSGYLFADGYSFPSAHATTIFLTITVLGAYFGWKYYAAGYVLAIAVGLSRLYLGVHYPSDVLAGAILGIALGELLVYAAYRYGLCDNTGLSSYLVKPVRKKGEVVYRDPGIILSIIVSLAATLSAIANYLSGFAMSVAILAIASMLVVLYTVASRLSYRVETMLAFVLAAIGLISALALLFLNAYATSLAIIAIAYLATILLKTHAEQTDRTRRVESK